MSILINPVQPPFLMPPPDGIEYQDNLGDNAYRQVMLTQHDGEQAHFDIPGVRLGRQATFDIPAVRAGRQATFDINLPGGRGLRITLGRAAGRNGVESNGYVLTFATGSASATIDDTADEIQLEFPDNAALSAVKTTVDAVAGLSSVYYGGEDGTSTVADYGDLGNVGGVGGTADEVLTHRGLRVTLGRAAGRIGADSNGYTMTFVTGAASAAIDDANDEVDLTFPLNTALSTVKTTVDAVNGLSSAYFGGEDGTSTVADYDDLDDVGGVGGTADEQSFDLGLRVTLARGTGRMNVQSNGYTMTFASGGASAAIDDANDEVDLVFPDATLLSAVKTTVDAVAGLSSEYFGGETGTSAVADFDALNDVQGSGATHDRAAMMRVMISQSCHAFVGTAAPTAHTRSRYLRGGDTPKMIYVTPGDRLWLQRIGGTDAAGSAELWVIEGGG